LSPNFSKIGKTGQDPISKAVTTGSNQRKQTLELHISGEVFDSRGKRGMRKSLKMGGGGNRGLMVLGWKCTGKTGEEGSHSWEKTLTFNLETSCRKIGGE